MIHELAGNLYNRFYARWDAHLAAGGAPDGTHPIWRAIECCERIMDRWEEMPEEHAPLP